MRVTATELSTEWFGFLTQGKRYTVLGLSFHLHHTDSERSTQVLILSDSGGPILLPFSLFVIDYPRVSRFWECRRIESGIYFLPAPFFQPFFLEDWYDGGSDDVREKFWQVYKQLSTEFGLCRDEWHHFNISENDIILAKCRIVIQDWLEEKKTIDDLKSVILQQFDNRVLDIKHDSLASQLKSDLIDYIRGALDSVSDTATLQIKALFREIVEHLNGERLFCGVDVSVLPLDENDLWNS
jgi:hypothetical protein